MVTLKNVNTWMDSKTQTFALGKEMILSPNAKDYLRNKGYAIVFGEKPLASDLEIQIKRILKEDYDIKGEEQLASLTDEILRRVK